MFVCVGFGALWGAEASVIEPYFTAFGAELPAALWAFSRTAAMIGALAIVVAEVGVLLPRVVVVFDNLVNVRCHLDSPFVILQGFSAN